MANILAFARDSLTNLVSRMGTARDKAAGSHYVLGLLSDEQLMASYRGAWLPRKIVDIPALDSVRAWRDWQATADQIEIIEAEEKRLNVKAKVLEAKIKARLWGGAAIMLGTGDENLAEELNPERIGSGDLKYLTVLTRRQLSAGEINRDPQSEWYGQPRFYRLQSGAGAQVDIHPSRLVIFHGNSQPDDDLVTINQGWGDSVLQSVMDAIKNADSTAANIASLVFEAKVDVVKLPNFSQNLGQPGYEEQVLKWLTLSATAKGINGTMVMDKESEYEQKTASFATLPDVLDRFLQIVSGAADIPATRLLGQSPAGMNATGESDLRNYYDRLAATQELEQTPAMARMDECIIRSALGKRDPAIHFVWRPLWGMSEKEKAEVFKMKADAARQIAGTGGMSPELMPIEALSKALVNELIEDGSLAGLEAAIEEFGYLDEQEDDDADEQAALGAANQNQPTRQDVVAADAAPRTLYVSRKLLNAKDVIRWAKSQGFETTLPAEDMHVTITYSRTPVDWFAMGSTWDEEMTIPPGGARMMEQFGEATVLLFSSNMLKWRHEEMVGNGASHDFPEYQPHVTISYGFRGDLSKVEPYQGKLVFGPELFAEVKEDWAEGLKET